MSLLKEVALLARLQPSLELVLSRTTITFPTIAPRGMALSVEAIAGGFLVRLGRWQGNYSSAPDAMEVIEAALQGDFD